MEKFSEVTLESLECSLSPLANTDKSLQQQSLTVGQTQISNFTPKTNMFSYTQGLGTEELKTLFILFPVEHQQQKQLNKVNKGITVMQDTVNRQYWSTINSSKQTSFQSHLGFLVFLSTEVTAIFESELCWVSYRPTLLRVFTFNLVFCFLFNFFLLKSFLLLKKRRKGMKTKLINSLPYPMVKSTEGTNVRSTLNFFSPRQREQSQVEFQNINQNIKHLKLCFPYVPLNYGPLLSSI